MRYLNEEVKCTEPSPSVSIPWLEFVHAQECEGKYGTVAAAAVSQKNVANVNTA